MKNCSLILAAFFVFCINNYASGQGKYYHMYSEEQRDSLSKEIVKDAPVIVEGVLIKAELLTLANQKSPYHILCFFEKSHVYRNRYEDKEYLEKDTFVVVGFYHPTKGYRIGNSFTPQEKYIILGKPNELPIPNTISDQYKILNLYNNEDASVIQSLEIRNQISDWFGLYEKRFPNRNELLAFFSQFQDIELPKKK